MEKSLAGIQAGDSKYLARRHLVSVLRFTALAAVLLLLGVSRAHAVDGLVKPVAFDYYTGSGGGCGDCTPSCGADSSCAAPGCADPGCADPCASACGCGGRSSLLGGPLTPSLQDLLLGECSAVTIGGWTQVGWHSDTTAFTPQTGLSFNNRPDELNLHQQWFYAEKVADGSDGLDWGFRTDIMYGIDGTDTQAFGNPAGSWDFLNGFDFGAYSWALPQAYLELAAGDFAVKMGHFYTLIGYEVVTAPDNFFYSHAFTMFNSEPFTHTGVLGSYNLGDATLYGGWTLGWDTGFDQLNGGSSFLGGFSVPLMEDITMTYICTAGNLGWRGRDGYSHSILFDTALTDDINWVLQSDFVSANSATVPGGPFGNDNSVGINNYLFYSLNDWIKVGSRQEWWKGDGDSHYALTSGLNLFLADNLVFRPEYRNQWSPANGVRDSIVGMDMILTY